MEYNCTLQNITDKPEWKVTNQKLVNFCLNESNTRRFPFKLLYPLCFVDYNCTTSQGKYLNTYN